MLKSFGLILLFTAVSYFHIPQLAKDKMIREIWIFSILMLFITVLAIAQINKVPIPNPLELIAIAVEPLSKLLQVSNK
ncbi:hypothetical protein [Alkalihalobacillus deserti]|uniref:hypothetical protein n=1 Tax=Alkalihalobacillus deserti TaxID=2879466 RepID=UPI001D147FF6|nr:hypothetical protein [Alkalihalobacillus deserti]